MDCFVASLLAMTEFCSTWSMTLEVIEGFAAVLATPQRLAGGRAEFGEQFGVFRTALRAFHLLLAEQRAAAGSVDRRRDAIFPQLPPSVRAHPVGGPGRRQHGA